MKAIVEIINNFFPAGIIMKIKNEIIGRKIIVDRSLLVIGKGEEIDIIISAARIRSDCSKFKKMLGFVRSN